MQPIRNNSSDGIYFTVETFVVDDNRELGKGVRDKDGYFTDVPVAVLGTVTRNMTSYDTPAFIKQLRGPDSSYNKRISEGNLFGEWGHPFVDFNSPSGMQRLLNLEPTKESHHIRSSSVKHVDDLDIDLIMIDSKGTGPYGQYYDEAMLDPTRNLSHSLRGISNAKVDRATGVTHKQLVSLVTFDAGMASGGFKEASKRYMASTEDLSFGSSEVVNVPVTPANIIQFRNVAMESITQSELNDILKANKVVIGSVVTGYVDTASKTIVDAETKQASGLFHTMINAHKR